MFGLLFPAVLDHYQEVLSDNLLCNYQYILQIPLEAMNEENKLSSLLSMMYFKVLWKPIMKTLKNSVPIH